MLSRLVEFQPLAIAMCTRGRTAAAGMKGRDVTLHLKADFQSSHIITPLQQTVTSHIAENMISVKNRLEVVPLDITAANWPGQVNFMPKVAQKAAPLSLQNFITILWVFWQSFQKIHKRLHPSPCPVLVRLGHNMRHLKNVANFVVKMKIFTPVSTKKTIGNAIYTS